MRGEIQPHLVFSLPGLAGHIVTTHHTIDIQGEAAGGLSILPSDHWQRRSDQGTVIDTTHHTMDIQGEAAVGLSILPSDHWQRRSDQGTAPLILAIIPWIFRVRQHVASAFFPQIIGKRGTVIGTSHHTINIQGEAAGGLSFLPSDHWQRRYSHWY